MCWRGGEGVGGWWAGRHCGVGGTAHGPFPTAERGRYWRDGEELEAGVQGRHCGVGGRARLAPTE
jgi:hypothetical protein